MDYAKIIRTAYQITMRHPRLWFFGLFLVGGFNLTFLRYARTELNLLDFQAEVWTRWSVFSGHPVGVSLFLFIGLLFLTAAFIATNWAKILLILHARKFLNINNIGKERFASGLLSDSGGHFAVLQNDNTVKDAPLSMEQSLTKESRRYLRPVIYISLLTGFIVMVGGLVLFLPPLFIPDSQSRVMLAWVAIGIFVFLNFVVSYLNIFATFFATLFQKNTLMSLNLAYDFLATHWKNIVILTAALISIYLLFFFAGVSIIFIMKYSIRAAVLVLVRGSLAYHGYLYHVLAGFSALGMWFLLAMLNVFINIALMIFFMELVRPIVSAELKEAVSASSVPVAGHTH